MADQGSEEYLDFEMLYVAGVRKLDQVAQTGPEMSVSHTLSTGTHGYHTTTLQHATKVDKVSI